jgi:hypothetical protein
VGEVYVRTIPPNNITRKEEIKHMYPHWVAVFGNVRLFV